MYLILEGEFSVIRDAAELNTLSPGDIVGEMAFLDSSKTRNASIECIEAGVVIAMIRYAMGEMLEKYPELHGEIQKIIQERNI